MDTNTPKVGYPRIRDVQGKHAQRIAAVAVGGYAFSGGLWIGQLLCMLLGVGG
jgi:hypothetical protein